MHVRRGGPGDGPLVVERARLARILEGRPHLTPADDPAVTAMLPGMDDIVSVATTGDGAALGAAWCPTHDPALLTDEAGRPGLELVRAVRPESRNAGVGTALIEAVAEAAGSSALSLNVHLLNPAVRLYVRSGF